MDDERPASGRILTRWPALRSSRPSLRNQGLEVSSRRPRWRIVERSEAPEVVPCRARSSCRTGTDEVTVGAAWPPPRRLPRAAREEGPGNNPGYNWSRIRGQPGDRRFRRFQPKPRAVSHLQTSDVLASPRPERLKIFRLRACGFESRLRHHFGINDLAAPEPDEVQAHPRGVAHRCQLQKLLPHPPVQLIRPRDVADLLVVANGPTPWAAEPPFGVGLRVREAAPPDVARPEEAAYGRA